MGRSPSRCSASRTNGLSPKRTAATRVLLALGARVTVSSTDLQRLAALERDGVVMIPYPGGDRIRAVTHYGIDAADIDRAIDATRHALAAVGLAPAPAPAAARA